MSVLDEDGVLTPAALAFVTERRLATLTTLRPDGSPHVVPVGFTWEPAGDAEPDDEVPDDEVPGDAVPDGGSAADPGADDAGAHDGDAAAGTDRGRRLLGTARVTMRASSRKARNVLAAGPEGARVSICSVDGRWWVTLEGRARLSTDPAEVADAVARYAVRYEREPAPDPGRGVVLVSVDRVMGNLRGR